MKDRFNNAVGPQVRTAKKTAGKLIPLLAVGSLAGGMQGAMSVLTRVDGPVFT